MNRKRLLTTAVAAVAAPLLVSGAAAAAGIMFTSPVTGTTTIAKTGETAQVPPGAFMTGELNGDTVTGNMTVPPTTTRVRFFGVPTLGDGNATVRIVETRPSVTKVNLLTGTGAGTAYFRIEVPAVYSNLLPGVNLVSPTCRTGEIVAPVTVEKFALDKAFPAKSVFDIPAFTGCGVAGLAQLDVRDALITNMVSGPGNTMDLMVGPGVLGG